jgi:CRISPR-associated protein Cmr2
MGLDWNDLLLAYLHDPPDKALDIRGHEKRAERYAQVAMDEPIRRQKLHEWTQTEDQLASIYERLPMPKAGEGGERAAGPHSDGTVLVSHPLSGRPLELRGCRLDGDAVHDELRSLLKGVDSPELRFLLLWRFLPERLAARLAWMDRLPADTRIPDHTIWNHCDMVAALTAARTGAHGPSFLSFSLGPVQPFIAAARTLRDLWSGSFLLAWLSYRAMRPIIDKLGPAVFVLPALRRVPLFDLSLREKEALRPKVPLEAIVHRYTPLLPNRFLALVPQGEAAEFAHACAESARAAWRTLGEQVRARLDEQIHALDPDWARRWDEQIESFWEVRTSVLPWREVERLEKDVEALYGGPFESIFEHAASVRRLAATIPAAHRPGYRQDQAGQWQALVDLAGRLHDARRAIRHVPMVRHEPGPVPLKCSLMGTYEQMGPDGLDESRKFWKAAAERLRFGGVRLRQGDRLCAVALVKRFAPAVLARDLHIPLDQVRFEDTATVAAVEWLRQAEIEPAQVRKTHGAWSGQWLHWPGQHFDEDEERIPDEVWDRLRAARGRQRGAPAYYAVLMLDGDHMGRWLRGELSPSVRELMHPAMVGYHQANGASAVLGAKRPLGPALYAAISEALGNFALHVAPDVVLDHGGQLVYAGGDDVLALLPLRTAMECAAALARGFSSDFLERGGRRRLLMGSRATVSAGLAVAHYKEDLRLVLQAARDAEKRVKGAGRDALGVTVLRRSGEHAFAVCSWGFVPAVSAWVKAFSSDKVSDRWAYRLRQDLETLQGLPAEAVEAEVRRQVARAEPATQEAFGQLVEQLRAYRELRRQAAAQAVLTDFVVLCQTASFLARGREER